MARTVGSKNKPKFGNMTRVINLNKQIENTPIINDEGYTQYVTWGKNNNFPDMLLDLYHNSVIHNACVDFIANAIVGDGVDYDKMNLLGVEVVPNVYEDWDELIHKLAMDLAIFGGYALQVIKNKNDETYSFFHQPFSQVRFGKKNDEGEIKTAFLCKDWSNVAKYKPIEIELVNTTNDIRLKSGKVYLLTYANYNLFDEYYPNPHYSSAYDSIRGDIKLKDFDLNSVTNNFSPNGALVLNRVDDENERKQILRNIEEMFSGSNNANNMIVTFKNSDADSPVTFVPFTSNVEGVNMFSDNNNRQTQRILSAHKIASKALIGLPLEGAGFASEASILEAAYNLTERLLIASLRRKLIGNLNVLFKMNGIDQKVVLKPLSFNLVDVDEDNALTDASRYVEEVENPEDENNAEN